MKIPSLWHHRRDRGVGLCGLLAGPRAALGHALGRAIAGLGALARIARRERLDRGMMLLGQAAQQRREVLHVPGDHVDHAGFVLQFAGHCDEPGAEHDRAVGFEGAQPQDRVGDTGLVFECHEDRLGVAGALPHQNEPRHRHAAP